MAYRKALAGTISPRTGGKTVQGAVSPTAEAVSALEKAKAVRVGQLWAAANAHIGQYLDASGMAFIVDARRLGNKKATKVWQWSQGVWRDYYYRRDTVMQRNTVADVAAVSVDFSAYGGPPHHFREIFDEIPV